MHLDEQVYHSFDSRQSLSARGSEGDDDDDDDDDDSYDDDDDDGDDDDGDPISIITVTNQYPIDKNVVNQPLAHPRGAGRFCSTV